MITLKKSQAAMLILHDIHTKVGHLGKKLIVVLRKSFWIPQVVTLVTIIVSKYITIYRCRSCNQKMGDLPSLESFQICPHSHMLVPIISPQLKLNVDEPLWSVVVYFLRASHPELHTLKKPIHYIQIHALMPYVDSLPKEEPWGVSVLIMEQTWLELSVSCGLVWSNGINRISVVICTIVE